MKFIKIIKRKNLICNEAATLNLQKVWIELYIGYEYLKKKFKIKIKYNNVNNVRKNVKNVKDGVLNHYIKDHAYLEHFNFSCKWLR